jgi:threonine aldolase
MSELLFASDNVAGISPEVMEALVAADRGAALPYGADDLTLRLNELYSAFFEHETFVFPAITGTAANALGIATITPPYGEVLCHSQAHVLTTEGGAPEFYAGGARLVGIECAHGVMSARILHDNLASRVPSKHHLRPSCLSLAQATELGTIYRPSEVAALAERAHAHEIRVHMDGARLANALVALNVTAADMTWRCGVDVLSWGTTNNGTLNGEAVIVFDPHLARDIAHRHKRAGLLASKMRYLSAQLIAYLKDDLWIRNARRANRAAARLAEMLSSVAGTRLQHPVQTNQVFLELDAGVVARLEAAGIRFRAWLPAAPPVYRLVTSFQTTDAEINRVAAAIGTANTKELSLGEPR